MDLRAIARTIIDTNLFMTLGTVDDAGRPWTTPVYYAASPDHADFYWVSAPDAAHSVHLATHPDVSIVIFNSQVRPNSGQAVYLSGSAGPVPETEIARGLEIFPGPAERGVRQFTTDDLRPAGSFVLYRATASRRWILCPRQSGRPCQPHGIDHDHRIEVGEQA